jgi:tRNA (guanine37-N1)-methyltransferase
MVRKRIVRIDFFTLFPEMFVGPLDSSILGRAVAQGLVNFNIHNIRDYTHDKHHTTDDYAYGGGAGMVMKPEPVFEAVEAVISKTQNMETGLYPSFY